MRQVDLDELTYQIFAGLRSWTPALRRRVFAPIALRRDGDLKTAAEAICGALRAWDYIDPATPQVPVGLDGIARAFIDAIPHFPGAVPALWTSGITAREREARAAAAILLAASLERFEILTSFSLHKGGQRVLWFRTPEAPDYAFLPAWP